MINTESIVVSGFSGLIGVIIGAIISSLLNHKLSLRLMKKETIFKQRILTYESIRNLIYSLYDVYRGISLEVINQEMDDVLNISKITLNNMSGQIQLFSLSNTKKEYLSSEIRSVMEEYKEKINYYCDNPPNNLLDIQKMVRDFNKYTNITTNKIDSEIGLRWKI